ncbi:Uncharacterised protein [Mycobacteroides abscessus subsp. abscessus]|nr:Uncharacterised protein [Mycobacteroides abscessus subsp. abscessus]
MYEEVDEVAMVTDMPQILPLMLDEATATDFDILALNADSIQLYHNHGHQVRPTWWISMCWPITPIHIKCRSYSWA